MFEVVKSEKGGRFPPLTEARSFRRMNPMRVLGVEFDPKLTLVIILGTLLPLIDIYDHTFFAAKSYDRFCEVAHPDCGKGKALAQIASNLGIDQSDVVAIGDNPNDMDMIEWAGLGIAMENAVDELKEAADWITGSIEEDGVAQAIEKFFKITLN